MRSVARFAGPTLVTCLAWTTACGGGDSTKPVVAATVAIAGGDAQRAPFGDTLPQPLAVTVNGSDGRAFAGATVTWGVAPAAAVTFLAPTSVSGADGKASTVVVVGLTAGTLSITATVASVPPASFSLQAVEPCSFQRPYAIGATLTGELATRDCLSGGVYIDYDSTTNASAQWLLFGETSMAFDAFLTLEDSAGLVLAAGVDSGPGTTIAPIRVLTAPGPYVIGASSRLAAQTGPYTLASGPTASDVTNCDLVWLTRGVQTSQQIQATDCSTTGGLLFDFFGLVLRAGQTVTLTQSSTAVDAYLELYRLNTNGSLTFLGFDDDGGAGTDALLVHTPAVTGIHLVAAETFAPGETGAYVLSVSAPAQAASSTSSPTLPHASRDLAVTPEARLSRLPRSWTNAAMSGTQLTETRP